MTTAPDPRSRRPIRATKRGLVRRDLIQQVATEKFLAHGFAAVSIDDIVREVGGSKTNVYSQFGNKEGLFVAVIEGLCDEFLLGFKQIDLSGLDAGAGLLCLGQALLRTLLQERHIAFQRLVLAESKRFPGLAGAWFDRGPQESRRVIGAFIAGRQQAGELRSGDPVAAAMLFHDMLVFNPTHLATIGRPPTTDMVDHHLRQVIDLFLLGMALRR